MTPSYHIPQRLLPDHRRLYRRVADALNKGNGYALEEALRRIAKHGGFEKHPLAQECIYQSLESAIKHERYEGGTGREAVPIIVHVKQSEVPEFMNAISPQQISQTVTGLVPRYLRRNPGWIHSLLNLAAAVENSPPHREAFAKTLGATKEESLARIPAYIEQMTRYVDHHGQTRETGALLTMGGPKIIDFVLSSLAKPEGKPPGRPVLRLVEATSASLPAGVD